eukprot:505955-Pelagomonas_calceolata.AAC.2
MEQIKHLVACIDACGSSGGDSLFGYSWEFVFPWLNVPSCLIWITRCPQRRHKDKTLCYDYGLNGSGIESNKHPGQGRSV